MPELDRFYREAANRAAIITVVPASSESGMRSLVMENGYTFPVLIDQGDIGSAYKVRYVPSLFVIDASGNLADHFIGGVDFAKLNGFIDALGG